MPEQPPLTGRPIARGQARGLSLCSPAPISFFGGVDAETGVVCEPGHPLFGISVAGRVLVFPHGKGSTVGSYVLYRLAKAGRAPAAILNAECEALVAVGAIIAEIPCVDQLPLCEIPDGAMLAVDGSTGTVTLP